MHIKNEVQTHKPKAMENRTRIQDVKPISEYAAIVHRIIWPRLLNTCSKRKVIKLAMCRRDARWGRGNVQMPQTILSTTLPPRTCLTQRAWAETALILNLLDKKYYTC